MECYPLRIICHQITCQLPFGKHTVQIPILDHWRANYKQDRELGGGGGEEDELGVCTSTMGNVKPIHHEPARVNQLSKELLTSGAIGAVKGGVIGLSTGLLLRYFSPTYRHIRTPLRVLYQVGWISVGAVFWADKQLISFEERMHQQEHLRRQKILDEAADRGIFLEDDRRNLDAGVHVSSTKD